MSNVTETPRDKRGLAIGLAFAAGVVLASSGWVGVERVALARPQDPAATKSKSVAAPKTVGGGLNPAEQRAEMIRLLRSIDRRLEIIQEKTK
ncbi:MAG: hypothetical protein IPH13_10530 [Planctomycetes bacterium]|nr:hypothetical protein [Planctomycetota bacterium]MCC7173463.1 hypothetical protein [Planctomycetota bacterium]